MRYASTRDGGLDVHQASLAVADASEARDAAVVFWGRIGTRPRAIDTRLRTRPSNATPLVFVDAAGPCGSWRSRSLSRTPLRCWVVAPALVPTKAGDGVKTDRRDATPLARLRRAGDVTPVDVPTVEDAAVRDLARACGGAPGSHGRQAPVEGLPTAPGDPG